MSAERFVRWSHALAQIDWPLFVTLTIPNSEDPEQLTRLKQCWQKFRRRKLIKSQVKGGLATYEITNKGNGWHPHLHSIMDCEWLAVHVPRPPLNATSEEWAAAGKRAQQELSLAWGDQIGQAAGIVHVRRVHGTGVIAEILKYAAKGSELLESPDPIAPMIRVLQKTRTLAGWGTLFPLPSPDIDDGPAVGCEDCGAVKSWIPSEIAYRFGVVDTRQSSGRTLQPRKQQ